MKYIGNYKIIDCINETRGALIYRGCHDKSDRSLIIKLLKAKKPAALDLARFRKEYEIIKSLDIKGVVKVYDLISHNGSIALILEDVEGISLKKYMDGRKLVIPEFLEIGVRLSEILGQLHSSNIIHKDIKPHNFSINPQSLEIKITDFGISSLLTHENEEIYNPDVIGEILAYMSPEQTGRINRSVDYRTDLYSLGVTLYEMLTGQVPFLFSDPLELIHAHIARPPAAPVQHDSSIPDAISVILMKLLAKTPDERYQSSFGLMWDLQACLRQLQDTGSIGYFEPGAKDISHTLHLSQKLIGRKQEKKILIEAFERAASGRTELLTVFGNPGIGKSMLIHELHRPVVEKRGYFIFGKYEQFRRNIPYNGIIQAFQGLIKQVLSESEERIEEWKNSLLAALGPNGKVITDVIPDVKLIIGEQPEIISLGPEEAQNRFNLVFANFIKVFSGSDHPMVICLDDIQWSGSASLNLLKYILLQREIPQLLIICIYRDSDVTTSSRVSGMLDDLRSSGCPMTPLPLPPLNEEEVNEFIALVLQCGTDHTLELARQIHKKTEGNPFFIHQFIRILYEERLIHSDADGKWRWDIKGIRAMGITDNVVELMLAKIGRFPENTRNMLTIAACIGNNFDIEMLSVISKCSLDAAIHDLADAVDEGMLRVSGDGYAFEHDRIHEAAYTMLSDDRKKVLHNEIGSYMLADADESELQENLFEIVDHLNYGIASISDNNVLKRIADLNLMAGQKARSSAAFEASLNYFKIGITLLGSHMWEKHYETTLTFHVEAAEAAYLSKKIEEMDHLIAIVLERAETLLDKVKVSMIQIRSLVSRRKLLESIETALPVLEKLNVSFPKKPGKPAIIMSLLRTRRAMKRRKIEEILELPRITDPDIMAALHILASVVSSTYFTSPELFPLIIFKQVRLSAKFGSDPASAVAYMNYAGILCGILGDIETGYSFGKLALALLDKLKADEVKSKVYVTFNHFIRHWKEHLRHTLSPLKEAYEIGLDTGDLEYIGHAAPTYLIHKFFTGTDLSVLDVEMQFYINAMLIHRHERAMYSIRLYRQVILNFMGKNEDPLRLIGDSYDERRSLNRYQEANDKYALFRLYFMKFLLCYMLREFRRAIENADLALLHMDGVRGTIFVPLFYFYNALAQLALYPEADTREQKKILKSVKKSIKKFDKWAGHAPMNHLHKLYLIKAERYKVLKDENGARTHYNLAIQTAHKNRYQVEKALCQELAALFWRDKGEIDFASILIEKAYKGYEEWGAEAKLEDMRVRYADFMRLEKSEKTRDLPSTGSSDFSDVLDISTVMRLSQAVTEEIVFNRLLLHLVRIALENAGAQRGFLILADDDKLNVEAYGEVGEDGIHVPDERQCIPLDMHEGLSKSIVNYVARTRDTLILDDAAGDEEYSTDPYIASKKPRSILCIPIILQRKLSGILYLENNLSKGAFSQERIKILNLVCSQAATALDNARLYERLEEKVKNRTAALQQAKDALWGEMELAKKIQTTLLPEKPEISGYEISAYMAPAEEVGGDYYDIIREGDISWLMIGDVSGHGVPSGLIMMMVQTAVNVMIGKHPDMNPSQLLVSINRTIYKNIRRLREDKYMTLTALSTHAAFPGRFRFSGLHQDIIIYRAGTGKVELVETRGLWVGITDDLSGMLHDDEFTLEPGDVLLLYSDGITEARKGDEFFGDDRLAALLKTMGTFSALDIQMGIRDAVSDYIPQDDITLLVMKRVG